MRLIIREKSYWFFHNLIRLPVILMWLPFEFLISIFELFKTMLTVDGSEELCWPWEHRE